MARKAKRKATPRPVGAPALYRKALAERVCREIAQGKSLVAICKLAWAPSYTTVMKWRREIAEFTHMYARAREDQADVMADAIVELADRATPKNYNAMRLRVDARKWVASKLKPRVYGDKLTQEHTGADGGPIKASVDLSTVPLDVLKALLTDDDPADEDT
jgi:hypothetical protein